MHATSKHPLVEDLRLVTFSLGDERFAVTVDRARGIVDASGLTPIDEPPLHVAGLLPHQGAAVPVLDTRSRLGLPPRGPGGKVLVVVSHGRQVGLWVDQVHQVITLPRGALRRAPAAITSRNDHVLAVFEWEGALGLLLDPDRLLHLPELATSAEPQS
jgi:purine-binding chemotaxis protein CheW